MHIHETVKAMRVAISEAIGSTAVPCASSARVATASADCAAGLRVGVGRPFIVEGEARRAPAARRPDWRSSEVSPETYALTRDERSRLGARWTVVAQMEHASIAAFARFSLQLLAMGAPPDLVVDAQRAMCDETVHARLAFGLASAYLGVDVGPGRLAIHEGLGETDLRSIVGTLFAEGCVGETVAALEAREALDHAREPAVREVLATIAEDEKRHAELAWRTIAWVVAAAGPRALAWMDDAITESVERSDWDGLNVAPHGDEDLLVHGVLSDVRRQEIRRAALAEVVIPCACAVRRRPTIAA